MIHYRFSYLAVGVAHSTISNISPGVPQGGILSAVFYNMYAADQPTSI